MGSILERWNIDVCAIQEIRRNANGICALGANYDLLYSGHVSGHGGAGVAIHRRMMRYMTDYFPISERIYAVGFCMRPRKVLLVSVYAPASSRPDRERRLFWDQLEGFLKAKPKGTSLIVLGDFNATLPPGRIAGISGGFVGENYGKSQNGDAMIHLCRAHGVSVVNTYFAHQKCHLNTYYHRPGRGRQIDFALMDAYERKAVNDARVYRSAGHQVWHGLKTDHHLLVITQRRKSACPRKERNTGQTRPQRKERLHRTVEITEAEDESLELVPSSS